jgi:Uma2 family endonuclease
MTLALAEQTLYTYGDYCTWPDDMRVELIEGVVYDMSQGPTRLHQDISGELFWQIKSYLRKGASCKVYAAPFDVRLPEGDEPDDDVCNVVQPDIVVVCDFGKLDKKGCSGAPDFIVEIISPSTAGKDHIQKLRLYEKHGVKEYWIVHPLDSFLTVRILQQNGKYGNPMIFEGKGTIKVTVLPELEIDLDAVFNIEKG